MSDIGNLVECWSCWQAYGACICRCVHPLAAKMAEPAAVSLSITVPEGYEPRYFVSYVRAPGIKSEPATITDVKIEGCVIEPPPKWDTLHRTQDGLPPDRPTWDSLDRTPDGGYTIASSQADCANHRFDTTTGRCMNPGCAWMRVYAINPYGSISTEPERTYTPEQREKGRAIADAITRR